MFPFRAQFYVLLNDLSSILNTALSWDTNKETPNRCPLQDVDNYQNADMPRRIHPVGSTVV